jgi:cytochrome c5
VAPAAAAATPLVAATAQVSACRKSQAKPAAAARPVVTRFSAAQLQLGKSLYVQQQCVTCHGEGLRGSPGAPALADAGFRSAWSGRSVQELLECTRSTMPPGKAGALSDADYLSLVGMILDANGFKSGDQGAALSWR